MATSKAKTIKLTDLAKVIETAVQASAGRKIPLVVTAAPAACSCRLLLLPAPITHHSSLWSV